MAQRFDTLTERLTRFIAEQKIFFVSTAPADGRVNLSPKGMLFDYQGERELLRDWAVKKGDEGIRAYWEEKNQFTLDGKPTGVLCKPTWPVTKD